MIKVVLLDIDDTLLSFSGYVKETMKEGFSRFGLAEYDDSMYAVFKTVNDAFWKQIEEGTLTFEELMKIRWNRIFKELGITFDGEVFEKYFRESLYISAIVEPGAVELLEYLKGKYTVCAASNGPYDQQIDRLRIGGLYGYFDDFFISERIGAQKPGKAFFDACLRYLREKGNADLLPEEMLIIGDSLTSDIAGGKDYGMQTCLYTGGREVPEGTADYVVKELSEITRFL